MKFTIFKTYIDRPVKEDLTLEEVCEFNSDFAQKNNTDPGNTLVRKELLKLEVYSKIQIVYFLGSDYGVYRTK